MSEENIIKEQEINQVDELKSSKVEMVYDRVALYKRVFSFLIDFILTFLLALSLTTLSIYIIDKMPFYQEYLNTEEEVKISSKLYEYYTSGDEKRAYLLPDIYDYNSELSDEEKAKKLEEAVNYFYLELNCYSDEENFGLNELNSYKENSSIFELVDGEYKLLDSALYSDLYSFYKDIIVNNSTGYFVNNDEYLSSTKNILLTTLLTILFSYLFSVIVFFYIVPLIFSRGRKTFGMLIFKFGEVDVHGISLSFGRFSARFAVFFIVEMGLSIFTLLVPFIVSVGMMFISKTNQTLSQYMVNTYCVMSDGKKIYKNFSEYLEANYVESEVKIVENKT